jgi:hypothetical protein
MACRPSQCGLDADPACRSYCRENWSLWLKDFLREMRNIIGEMNSNLPNPDSELQMDVSIVMICGRRTFKVQISDSTSESEFERKTNDLVEQQRLQGFGCDFEAQLELQWIYHRNGEMDNKQYWAWEEWTNAFPWQSLAEKFDNKGRQEDFEEDQIIRYIVYTLVPFAAGESEVVDGDFKLSQNSYRPQLESQGESVERRYDIAPGARPTAPLTRTERKSVLPADSELPPYRVLGIENYLHLPPGSYEVIPTHKSVIARELKEFFTQQWSELVDFLFETPEGWANWFPRLCFVLPYISDDIVTMQTVEGRDFRTESKQFSYDNLRPFILKGYHILVNDPDLKALVTDYQTAFGTDLWPYFTTWFQLSVAMQLDGDFEVDFDPSDMEKEGNPFSPVKWNGNMRFMGGRRLETYSVMTPTILFNNVATDKTEVIVSGVAFSES